MIVKELILIAIFIFSGYDAMAGLQDSAEGSIPVVFTSDSSKLAGRFFPAKGAGPFPTVILLQGLPGGEGDIFGLGQRFSKEGINVFTFNYRGTWKSEGLWLPLTSLEDVKSSINFLKSPQITESLSIDTAQLSIVGYSYGGGMALLGSLFDPAIRKVVSIAGGDLNVVAGLIEKNPEFKKEHQQFMDNCMADSNMVRGLGGKASHEWLLKNRYDYDIIKHAKELSNKTIFLIGGWRDQAIRVEDHILPLFRALQECGAKNLKIEVFDTDHSFEGYRDSLADCIVDWIKQ
ncbi:MAG TPA: alpha/beta fold hydrolase [Terriglobales bacterium]|nr:alpha/beta fold hydrolase [Terriglobales bacterium]